MLARHRLLTVHIAILENTPQLLPLPLWHHAACHVKLNAMFVLPTRRSARFATQDIASLILVNVHLVLLVLIVL